MGFGNKMLSRFVNRVNPIGGSHRRLHVCDTTRLTHVSPLHISLRSPASTQGSWLSDSVLCGTGLWLAIAFVPKWTSLDALTSVGEVSADYNEEPLCAPNESTEQDLQRRSQAGNFHMYVATWSWECVASPKIGAPLSYRN